MRNFIVALDNMKDKEIYGFLDLYADKIDYVKIGMEVFNRYGKKIIKDVAGQYGVKIFLDLKLHDIPSTVAKGIRSLEGLPVDFLTIHLGGGEAMIKDAMKSKKEFLPHCKLLGVSVLTSIDNKESQRMWAKDTEEIFKSLYTLACDTKIDGIVCSGHELTLAASIDKESNHKPLKVTPGIRLESDDLGDQKRVMTPKKAMSLGADFLVIGRSITQAKYPEEVLDFLLKS